MSEDLLLPDENNIGLMLREYNLIATRNKLIEENGFVTDRRGVINKESEEERKKELCREYAEIYCLEQDLCTSMYRLHSLANPRVRNEIGIIIGEIKRNTKRIMEGYCEISREKLTISPKIELSMNYWKLLRENVAKQQQIMIRLTAIENADEKLRNIIQTELVISSILNSLLAMYKM